MADFVNVSASTLEVGGKSYAPGAKMTLTAAQLKDPTVDWWKRQGYVKEGTEAPVSISSPAYIPSDTEIAEGRTVQMTDAGTVPVAAAPEVPPKK